MKLIKRLSIAVAIVVVVNTVIYLAKKVMKRS